MPGDRFRVALWNLLFRRHLRSKPHLRERWRCAPRVETLEPRTLLSSLPVAPPGTPFIAEIRMAAVTASIDSAPPDVPAAFLASPGDTGLNAPGLAGLLNDIRQLDTPYSPETLQTLYGDSVAQIADAQAIAQAPPVPAMPPAGLPHTGVHTTVPGPVSGEANAVAQTPPPGTPSGPMGRTGPVQAIAPGTPAGTPSQVAVTAPASRSSATALDGDPVVQSTTPASTITAPPAASSTADVAPLGATSVERADDAPAAALEPAANAPPVDEVVAPAPALPDAGDAYIESAHAPVAAGGVSDGVMLERFAHNGDQAAFTALVERHEPMVLNVCRRVLGDAHAAEDAAQATFLVLARKAGLLDGHRPLARWLYTVAYHLALRLRAVLARQRRSEQAARGRWATAHEDGTDLEDREVHQVLNEELQRLPEKYRLPLALCYLNGHTHAEAARAIGMPRGSVAKTVGEGLARLRDRLVARGITL